jgi:hypothetical protein
MTPEIPGHHHIAGSDLELVFELRGHDLSIRVNKGGVLIFKTLLVGAAEPLTDVQALLRDAVERAARSDKRRA